MHCILGLTFISFVYNVEPFRFKSKPGLDLLSNGISLGLLIPLAAWSIDQPLIEFPKLFFLSTFCYLLALYCPTMAISKAKESGCEAVICASTGNTSASAAAYARRGGMRAFVIIPDGYVAQGKLAQALVYGAEVLAIKGNFDKALDIVRELSDKYPITLVNSVNPYRLQGQKTAAFEIIENLGNAPDWLCIPMGNAGNISAYWMGFQEYFHANKSKQLPRMMGFQASGSAPLVEGKNIDNPETIATAIRIGNPVNKEKAISAKESSKGRFSAVTDLEIINAYKILGKEEGIFCEPASAASVAGLLKLKNDIPKNSTIVCVLTGNGLKDPDCAIENNDSRFHKSIEPDINSITKTMGF